MLYFWILFHRSYLKEMFSRYRSAAEGVTRSRSLKKTLNTPTAIKKNSHCLQLIYQVVSYLGIMLEKACLVFNQPNKNWQNAFFFNTRLYFFFISTKDTILDAIRKTKVNFVRCILPVDTAGQLDGSDTAQSVSRTGKEISSLNVPLVRHQLRSAEMLDAVRIHRQG